MAFQFTCPHGHLIEGDESLANQATQCPTCGVMFLVPEPLPAPAPAAPEPALSMPVIGKRQGFHPAGEAPQPKLFHIPCPQGHELETPQEMLGDTVMCPFCGVQFTLRETDSIEYLRKKESEQEAADRKSGNFWLNWAVAFAVIVVIGLAALIGLTGSSKPNKPASYQTKSLRAK